MLPLHAGAPPARRGFTLLELMLVMALLATIFGVGLGMFASLDLAQARAVFVVKDALRRAQNAAVTRRAPAAVRIDAAARTVTPEVLVPIGTWSFEPGDVPGQVYGAFGLNGDMEDAQYVDDGWIGHGLGFGERGSVEIPVQDDPAWDLSQGFVIQLAVRREGKGGGRLLRLGRMLGLDVGGGGELRGWIVPRLDATILAPASGAGGAALLSEDDGAAVPGRGRRGGRVIVESAAGAVPVGRWVRVRMEYDRRRLELVVDGVPLARQDETREVWDVDGPLVLSDASIAFPGSVDVMVVSAVVADQPQRLPDSVRLVEDPPAIVRFDADGELDREAHPGPVRIVLELANGSREPIDVGLQGTVDG